MTEVNKERFINPYHFIPLTEKCNREKENNDGSLLTGKIIVEIGVKTPLFIPNISSERKVECDNKKENSVQEKEHSCFEFFSYHQYKEEEIMEEIKEEDICMPVIPGSEIRGMIRSNYEAVTESCMSALSLEKPLFKRTSDCYKLGWLTVKEKEITLYQAKNIYKINLEDPSIQNLKDGEKVVFTVSGGKEAGKIREFKNEKLNENERIGYLLKGEKGPVFRESKKKKMKHWAKVLEQDSNKKEVSLNTETIQSFEKVLKTYADERINHNINTEPKHNGYKEYSERWDEIKKAKNGSGIPVYFSKVKENYYLSPACITKESYLKSIEQIIKEQGSFQPCAKEELCQACNLFGMVDENGKSAKASKIRFADAVWSDSEDYKTCFEMKTLEELAQPKLSATEFYLQKPDNADFWTYDYKAEEGKIELYKANIMGRKFYWHQKVDNWYLPDNVPKTNRNKTVRMLKKGTFQETIYFEKITENQLKQLLYLLNISNIEKNSGFKIGMGKPLGLGSITMKVLKAVTRKIDLSNPEGYREEPYDANKISYDSAGLCQKTKLAFQKAIHFYATKGYLVTYPVTKSQFKQVLNHGLHEEGFKWFIENRGGNKINTRNKICIKESLKPVNSTDISLKIDLNEEV